jgi:hypothetical protein
MSPTISLGATRGTKGGVAGGVTKGKDSSNCKAMTGKEGIDGIGAGEEDGKEGGKWAMVGSEESDEHSTNSLLLKSSSSSPGRELETPGKPNSLKRAWQVEIRCLSLSRTIWKVVPSFS